MIRGGGIDTEPADGRGRTPRGRDRRRHGAGLRPTQRTRRRRRHGAGLPPTHGLAGEVADVEAAGNNVADPAGDADEAGTGDDCAAQGEGSSQESSKATTSIDGQADRPIILAPLRDGSRGGMTYRPFR